MGSRKDWAIALLLVGCGGVTLEEPLDAGAAGAPQEHSLTAGNGGSPGTGGDETPTSAVGGDMNQATGGASTPTAGRGASDGRAGRAAGGQGGTPESSESGGMSAVGRGGTKQTPGSGGMPAGEQGGAGEWGGESGAGTGGDGECTRGTYRSTETIDAYYARSELEALRGYTHFVGDLMIAGLEPIADVEPLHCLERIGGNLYIDGRDGLTLRGLENLKSIAGSLGIIGSRYDADLPDLTGLDGLTTVGNLQLSGVSSLHGLESLTTIEGILSVNSEYAAGVYLLTSLDGLEGLRSVSEIFLYINDGLENIEALSHVTEVNTLSIMGNRALATLEGFRNLERVRGDLVIDGFCFSSGDCEYNDVLTSLRGLRSLAAVEGLLAVENNPKLPTCEAEWLRDSVGNANIGDGALITNNTGTGDCATN